MAAAGHPSAGARAATAAAGAAAVGAAVASAAAGVASAAAAVRRAAAARAAHGEARAQASLHAALARGACVPFLGPESDRARDHGFRAAAPRRDPLRARGA